MLAPMRSLHGLLARKDTTAGPRFEYLVGFRCLPVPPLPPTKEVHGRASLASKGAWDASPGSMKICWRRPAEGGLFDRGTGMTLGAWVDRRVGGGNISTAVQWQWGDVENVMNEWAS